MLFDFFCISDQVIHVLADTYNSLKLNIFYDPIVKDTMRQKLTGFAATCPTVHNPIFLPKPNFQPSRHLRSKSQIQNGNKIENGSAVPSQSTSPTSPLSKSAPNCLLSASFRNSLSSKRTLHSHSSFLARCSKRMSLASGVFWLNGTRCLREVSIGFLRSECSENLV